MIPSKILLFGEYAILLESDALAIPFTKFGGMLDFPDNSKVRNINLMQGSNTKIKGFLEYLLSVPKNELEHSFEISRFKKDIQNGLYFRSDIPESSGLGSSGSLVAAVYRRYQKKTAENAGLEEFRRTLAMMESYFHKRSSGIDPLVSYMNAPLVIENGNRIRIIDFATNEIIKKYGVFLVYSQSKSNTFNLVQYFIDKCQNDIRYTDAIQNQYIPLNNKCVESLSAAMDKEYFYSLMQDFLPLHLTLFRKMLPEVLIPVIKYGLRTKLFYLKLCGSGGGGYLLGFTGNIKETEEYLRKSGCQLLIC